MRKRLREVEDSSYFRSGNENGFSVRGGDWILALGLRFEFRVLNMQWAGGYSQVCFSRAFISKGLLLIV